MTNKMKALSKHLAVATVLVATLGVTQASFAGYWRHCTVWRVNGQRVRWCNGGWGPGPYWPRWHRGWHHGWWHHGWYRRHCRVWIGPWGGEHRRCW